jgi:hypothetical protein
MTHSTPKIEITADYAQRLYKFLNLVNVPFEEKEGLIVELREAYQNAHNNNNKIENDGKS